VNPAIIIPTYWSRDALVAPTEVLRSYDHMSELDDFGELPRCLYSLKKIGVTCRIIVVVVASEQDADAAYKKVFSMSIGYPDLDILVIGAEQVAALHERMDELGLSEFKKTADLTSYGAVKNVGLLVGAVLGHTELIFLDDDMVVEDSAFLDKGLYCLGKLTRHGIPVLAKTGYYINRSGQYTAEERRGWSGGGWLQEEGFNHWIEEAMHGARITPARSACGGCLAVDHEAYQRLAFDPWIPRGEDLDYLLSMRLYGFDIWFDNAWSLKHYPPEIANEAVRFRSDYYRWVYEQRKVAHARTQVDLMPIVADKLNPYPGPLLKPQNITRMKTTARLHSFDRRERSLLSTPESTLAKDAEDFAENNYRRSFQFQYAWPEVYASFVDNKELYDYLARCAEERKTELEKHTEAEEKLIAKAQESLGSAEEIADRWARRAKHAGKRPSQRKHE
jgi:hypothetical protein